MLILQPFWMQIAKTWTQTHCHNKEKLYGPNFKLEPGRIWTLNWDQFDTSKGNFPPGAASPLQRSSHSAPRFPPQAARWVTLCIWTDVMIKASSAEEADRKSPHGGKSQISLTVWFQFMTCVSENTESAVEMTCSYYMSSYSWNDAVIKLLSIDMGPQYRPDVNV